MAICEIWIGVWKGPPYLSIISVGGSMDVSSGHWLVLHDFIVVTYLTCYFFTVFADHVLYAFNVVCRTPIRHVSSSNGWTRTHAYVAVQQHHLSRKGLPDIRPRPWLQEMKGMRLMQGK